MMSLIAGLWSGVIRIGWNLPLSEIAVHHGAIMVGSFFTTLVSLEKAIPLKRKIAFAVPVFSGLTLLITISSFYQIGIASMIAGSVGLLTIQCWYMYTYRADRAAPLMAIGAAFLVIGNVHLATTRFYPSSFPWWMGFLLFTIVGERLELSRFLPVPAKARNWMFVFLGVFFMGLVLPFHGTGKYLSGVALVGISFWLLRHDVIGIGLRHTGLARYAAFALLAGNLALMVEGIFLLVLPDSLFAYDSLVHTFFIGFGVTMVFAHGPIILPSVLGSDAKPYTPVLYAWVILLQVSLYLRLISNSLLGLEFRKASGLLTASAIVFYFITIVVSIFRNRQHATAH